MTKFTVCDENELAMWKGSCVGGCVERLVHGTTVLRRRLRTGWRILLRWGSRGRKTVVRCVGGSDLDMKTSAIDTNQSSFSRREMLSRLSSGFGMAALSGLMGERAFGATTSPVSHHRAKVKNVILCYMSGGASQIDSFDPKPKLHI